MEAIPLLHLDLAEDGFAVIASRDSGVPDEFWLLLRAEWGSEGRVPLRAIEVPVERLLSRRAWLTPACRRHRVGIEWDERVRELVLDSRNEKEQLDAVMAAVEELPPPELERALSTTRLSTSLHDFQLEDLARLLRLPHGANFSVPGAGKTAVTYALYELERARGRVDRLLVVAPLSAFDAWQTEAQRCFATPPHVHAFSGAIPDDVEVLLVNYQRLAASYTSVGRWVAQGRAHVVLDEAHRMKRGRAGQWGTASLDLAYIARRRDILTGTPAPQSPLDLEALLNFVWPNQARRVLPADVLVPRPLTGALEATGDAISPLFVRTTKDQLGLPPVNFGVELIPLSGLHRDIYAALLDQYAGTFGVSMRDRLNFSAMGRVTMYLLEAATNPALLPVGSSRYDPVEFQHPPLGIPEGSPLASLIADYGQYETPGKFTRLADLVVTNAEGGRKTLIWSNFVRNLETLRRMLHGLEPALIHGGVVSDPERQLPGVTRESEIERFRRDDACMVLLANPAAMSEGLSLHLECHDAVYVDRTFNAGQYLQSVDRIHRLGLRPGEETNITFLQTEGTIDQVVDLRIGEKAERLSTMLRDPGIITMSLPDDEDYGPVVDTERDMVALFEHLRGESRE